MDKILVSIYVASLDEYYDVFLPINLKLSEALDLVQNTITELSSGNYQKHSNAVLLNSDAKVLNNNNVVRLSGFTNGCRVVLI
jgi:hypothetical protein